MAIEARDFVPVPASRVYSRAPLTAGTIAQLLSSVLHLSGDRVRIAAAQTFTGLSRKDQHWISSSGGTATQVLWQPAFALTRNAGDIGCAMYGWFAKRTMTATLATMRLRVGRYTDGALSADIVTETESFDFEERERDARVFPGGGIVSETAAHARQELYGMRHLGTLFVTPVRTTSLDQMAELAITNGSAADIALLGAVLFEVPVRQR